MDMEQLCKQFETRLADLAEGKPDHDASAHVASCGDCAATLRQLQAMFHAASIPVIDAPQTLTDHAKAIMRAKRPAPIARLLGTSFSLAQARSVAQDFQLVVGAGEENVRLMFQARPDGSWDVTGRTPGAGWQVFRNGVNLETDQEDGFTFQSKKLDDTSFSLRLADSEISVPSAQELLDGDSS